MLRKIAFLFSLSILTCSLFAQVPEQFNYQAALRDDADQVLSNTAVTMRFTIRQSDENGPIMYQESQSLVTDELGLLNAAIGSGTVLQGDFGTIEWIPYAYYLQVEANDGGGYVSLGASKLSSVPFAMHSASTSNLKLPFSASVTTVLPAIDISNGFGSAAKFSSDLNIALDVESNSTGIRSIVNTFGGSGYGIFTEVTTADPSASPHGIYTSATGSPNARGVLSFSDGVAVQAIGLGTGAGVYSVCEQGTAGYFSTNCDDQFRPTFWLNENDDDYVRMKFSNYSNNYTWQIGAKYLPLSSEGDFNISLDGTELMHMSVSGNTGFGTTDPQDLLHVHDSDYGVTRLRLTNNYSGQTINDGLYLEMNDEFGSMLSLENTPLSIGTNNYFQLRIEPNNNHEIHIGSFASLNVLETFHGNSSIQLNNNVCGFQSTDGLRIEMNDNTASIVNNENASLLLGTNNNYNLFISPNGKIGIGGVPSNGMLEIRQNSQVAYNSGMSFVESGSSDYWAHGYGTSDDYDYYWNGALKAYVQETNGAWTQGSDRSLKNSINYFEKGIAAQVAQLKPCSYFYNNSGPEAVKSIGFIAQEVAEVFPELVYEKDGIKTLAYTDFAVLAVASVKEQQEEIANLKLQNASLMTEFKSMSDRLLEMEQLISKLMADEK